MTARLHFDRNNLTLLIQQKIHFISIRKPPVSERNSCCAQLIRCVVFYKRSFVWEGLIQHDLSKRYSQSGIQQANIIEKGFEMTLV